MVGPYFSQSKLELQHQNGSFLTCFDLQAQSANAVITHEHLTVPQFPNCFFLLSLMLLGSTASLALD